MLNCCENQKLATQIIDGLVSCLSTYQFLFLLLLLYSAFGGCSSLPQFFDAAKENVSDGALKEQIGILGGVMRTSTTEAL